MSQPPPLPLQLSFPLPSPRLPSLLLLSPPREYPGSAVAPKTIPGMSRAARRMRHGGVTLDGGQDAGVGHLQPESLSGVLALCRPASVLRGGGPIVRRWKDGVCEEWLVAATEYYFEALEEELV